MSTLECVSCGIKQNNQNFYEFQFETGPHCVCTSCFHSDALHTVDPAVAAQHDVNLAKAQDIRSRITQLDAQIKDLTMAQVTQKNEQCLLAAAQHHMDTTDAYNVQLQLVELEIDLNNLDRQRSDALRTLRNQRVLLAAMQAILLQDAALQTRAHHQAIRNSMKTVMPDAIRLILPQANRTFEAFLMALHPELGQHAPASVLTGELGHMICQHLVLPRTSERQELDNCVLISDIFLRVHTIQPLQHREAVLLELERHAMWQRLTLEQTSLAHSNTLQLPRTNVRETFEYIMTLQKFSKNPFGSFMHTDQTGPPLNTLSDPSMVQHNSAFYRFNHLENAKVFFQCGLTTLAATDRYGNKCDFPVCIMVFHNDPAVFHNEPIPDARQNYPDIEQHATDEGTEVPRCTSDYTNFAQTYLEYHGTEFQHEQSTTTFFVYNLGHKDLVLAPGTVQASFGMHRGDLISYCAQNPEYSHLFDDTIIPAKGIANIGTLDFLAGDDLNERYITDANNDAILVLAVSIQDSSS